MNGLLLGYYVINLKLICEPQRKEQLFWHGSKKIKLEGKSPNANGC